MSYRSHVAAPSRVFDHIYDPIFTTSDSKNVYKENCIALTRSAPIRVYPVYNSMFSELNYEERNCYAYQKNILPYIPSKNNFPNEKVACVTGADRSKFFSNPLSNIRTINVGLMADKYIENEDELNKQYKNKAMQTLYRESSAQTKSWLPECFTNEMTLDVPEVVYVADMIETVSYPGLKEVEIIERARKRRAWELTLPPIKTVSEIPTRVAALEAFEWEEWITREKDINEYQQARLQIVADLIEKREQKHKTNMESKLQNTKKRALKERSRQKDLLINNFQRCMRKIELARRKEVMKNVKDDPVLIHYDKKSDYTIPKIQIGGEKHKKRTQIEYSNDFKNRFASLEQKMFGQEDIQNYMKPIKQDLWIPKKPSKEIERGIWNENYLKRLHETLKQFRRKKALKRNFADKSSLNLEKNVSTFLPSSDDPIDKDYQDKTLVQKTIKGRAVQSMLRKGIKKVQDAIDEAKETHSIAAVRKLFPKEFSQQIDCQEAIIREYNRIDQILKNDKKLQEELKKIESKDVRNLLNYFGKELNRLQSEKQAHALYLLAERERYRREAEKLGEHECEEQFKNDSVTLYLENILLEGINRAFDDSSRCIIREMAQKIDCKASKVITFNANVEEIPMYEESSGNILIENHDCKSYEDSEKQLENRKVVTELLIDNMIPRITFDLRNSKLVSRQKEYLTNAHNCLYQEEFEKAKKEEERLICITIFNEIIESSLTEFDQIVSQDECKNLSRQTSFEAELLASQIVEEILSDIIENDQQELCQKMNGIDTKTECEDEILVFQSETESSDDLLAEIVTYDVLNDIVEYKTSSTSEMSDTSEFEK